jgi:Mce-associated membrane protein
MNVKRPPTRRPRVAGHNRIASSATVPDDAVSDDVAPDDIVQDELASTDPVSDSVVSEDVLDDDIVADEPRRFSTLVLGLVSAAAVLAGLGVFFLAKGQSTDQGVDTRAMTEINGQVKDSLEKIFSFSYDKVDTTATTARQVLAGTAVTEYEKLIEQVRTQAPEQKLVLATKVTSAGVKSLDGDRAELLVFLDQVATRVDTGKTSGSAAALSVKVERLSGVWRIVELIPR